MDLDSMDTNIIDMDYNDLNSSPSIASTSTTLAPTA